MAGGGNVLMENGTSFFSNKACAFFPCHEGVAPDEFNCLFCYCPLYALGPECGGKFSYNEKGYKVCTRCTRPHEGAAGAQLVLERYPDLAALARGNSESASGDDGGGVQ